MGRSPCCEEAAGVKKGPWTPEEDKKLADYIRQHGPASWRALPKLAGLNRCSKSCRLRWTNYLRPDIKRGNFSGDEQRLILHLHSLLGNKWSAMAARLPGRTDNEIKNYWNTHLKKKLLRAGIDPVTHRPRSDLALLGEIILGQGAKTGPSTGGGAPAAAVRLLREVIWAVLAAAPSSIGLAEVVSSALSPGSSAAGAPPPGDQLLDGAAAAALGSLFFFPDSGQPHGQGRRAAPFEGEETFPSPSSEVVASGLKDVHIDFNPPVDHPPPRSCRYSAASTPSLTSSSSSSSSATAMDQLQEIMIDAGGDAPDFPLAPWMDLPDADSDFYWKDMLEE